MATGMMGVNLTHFLCSIYEINVLPPLPFLSVRFWVAFGLTTPPLSKCLKNILVFGDCVKKVTWLADQNCHRVLKIQQQRNK